MLTKYYKKLAAVSTTLNIPFDASDIKLTNGSTPFSVLAALKPYTGNFISATYGDGIVFGDSDEPESEDDYYLKGSKITGLTSSVAVQTAAGSVKKIFTLTNNSSSPVTIKEVCFYAQFYYYSMDGGGNAVSIMVDRTVLDTPVTIPAGGVGQVVYTITSNYLTAAADAGGTN